MVGSGDGDDEDPQLGFWAAPGARSSDPYTSWIAAAYQTPERVAPVRAAVLLAFFELGPITDGELHARVGGPDSTPRKRRGELVAAGFIEAAGEGRSEYGKPSIIWRLTSEGESFVRKNRGVLVEIVTKKKKGRP